MTNTQSTVTINHPSNRLCNTSYIVVLEDKSTGRQWFLGKSYRTTRQSLWEFASDAVEAIASIVGSPAETISGTNAGKSGYYSITIDNREGLVIKFAGTSKDNHGKTFNLLAEVA